MIRFKNSSAKAGLADNEAPPKPARKPAVTPDDAATPEAGAETIALPFGKPAKKPPKKGGFGRAAKSAQKSAK